MSTHNRKDHTTSIKRIVADNSRLRSQNARLRIRLHQLTSRISHLGAREKAQSPPPMDRSGTHMAPNGCDENKLKAEQQLKPLVNLLTDGSDDSEEEVDQLRDTSESDTESPAINYVLEPRCSSCDQLGISCKREKGRACVGCHERRRACSNYQQERNARKTENRACRTSVRVTRLSNSRPQTRRGPIPYGKISDSGTESDNSDYIPRAARKGARKSVERILVEDSEDEQATSSDSTASYQAPSPPPNLNPGKRKRAVNEPDPLVRKSIVAEAVKVGVEVAMERLRKEMDQESAKEI